MSGMLTCAALRAERRGRARHRTRRAGRATEGGSASTELVLLTPLAIVLVSVCFIAGRLVLARQQIDDAARAASQAAAVASGPLGARYAATVTVIANLEADGLACSHLAVTPGTATFRPGGKVSVSVSCTVPLSHLSFGRLPGSVRLTAVRSAIVEPYRQLGP